MQLLGASDAEDWPAPAEVLGRARAFLEGLQGRRVALAPDKDVDGLTSAVLAWRALEAAGAHPFAVLPAKGEHVHSPALRARLAEAKPDALCIFDQGSREGPVLSGVPTLLVDHHVPDGFPPGALVVTGHWRDPVPPTSLLTFVTVGPLVEAAALEWLGVLGTVADLGASAPMPQLPEALRRAGRTATTEAISLLNAARRSARFEVGLALDVLRAAGSAADISKDRVPGVERLRELRLEVQRETERCARTPPRVVGDVVLLLFSSAAQVHPLVAVRWAQRMAGKVVVAANAGYLPGRVNFALRTRAGVDLLALLRGLDLGPVGGEFARGHPQATGGSLAPADFVRMLEALGFRGVGPQELERRGVAPG